MRAPVMPTFGLVNGWSRCSIAVRSGRVSAPTMTITSPRARAVSRLIAVAFPLRSVSTSTLTIGKLLATPWASSTVASVQPLAITMISSIDVFLHLLREQRMQRAHDVVRFVVREHADGAADHRTTASLAAFCTAGSNGAGRSCRFSQCQPTRARLFGSHIIEL